MRFELRPGQSLPENLCRLYRKQIDGALAVAHGRTEGNDTRVHAIRKHLKKARALLCLVRKSIGRKAFRKQDHWLRDAGRAMREIRDAEVRLDTMRQIEDVTHRHYLSYRKIERLLALELENFVAAFDGWEEQAILMLQKARCAVDSWSISVYGNKELRRAVQRAYKCGVKALQAVETRPSTANLHALRKRVKMLGYQMRILCPLNPVMVSGLSQELTELGDLLGRVHDLSFLARRLRKERAESHWGKQDDHLLAVVRDTQAELQRDGIEIGAKFFAERPSKFGSHIAECIKDWRYAERKAVAARLAT